MGLARRGGVRSVLSCANVTDKRLPHANKYCATGNNLKEKHNQKDIIPGSSSILWNNLQRLKANSVFYLTKWRWTPFDAHTIDEGAYQLHSFLFTRESDLIFACYSAFSLMLTLHFVYTHPPKKGIVGSFSLETGVGNLSTPVKPRWNWKRIRKIFLDG